MTAGGPCRFCRTMTSHHNIHFSWICDRCRSEEEISDIHSDAAKKQLTMLMKEILKKEEKK